MPAIVGAVELERTQGGVSFGDLYKIAQKSVEKTYLGSGVSSIGDFKTITNERSSTYYVNKGVSDQGQTLNK